MSEVRRSWQRCDACAAEYDERDAAPRCAACGGLLAIVHTPPSGDARAIRARFDAACCARPSRTASGVWRFAEVVLPTAAHVAVTHPEGNTPLITRSALDAFAGVDELLLKHEGHNPTGSFKDRGMTVGVTQAKRIGARAVACASTGNTSASLAAYAAQAGLPALVFVPEGQIALGKLTQSLAYGARTLLVEGDFDACLRLVQHASEVLGIYLLNSINPFRVEGQKTIVLEMLQQLAWDVPEWIVLPAGNLGNTAAFGKALLEAYEWGLIPRLPRLAAIQAEGASPFAQAFARDFDQLIPMAAHTVATAIKIGAPASYDRAVRAIRATHGVVRSVTATEILTAKAAIDAAGVGCEPASAATLAGIRQLRADGVIRSGERVVGVLTGHVLKDPGILQTMHQETEPQPSWANRPIRIAPEVDAVRRVLDAALLIEE
ncbi:MAG: threonine synthase [Gemmatimonadetes bacterium]|nr:threonine synthase [Gemmatimonadota bacterium]